MGTVGVGFSPARFCPSAVDTTEDTLDDTLEDKNPKPTAGDSDSDGQRGVASGVLLGVACRSRTLIRSVRSLVAASRMDTTPTIVS